MDASFYSHQIVVDGSATSVFQLPLDAVAMSNNLLLTKDLCEPNLSRKKVLTWVAHAHAWPVTCDAFFLYSYLFEIVGTFMNGVMKWDFHMLNELIIQA